MAGCCHHDHCETARADGTYRRVLWAALTINAVMFGVEGAAGILSGSVALKADALDFLGDAANYGISLCAVGQAVHWRSRAALAKAAGMGLSASGSSEKRSTGSSSPACRARSRWA